MAVKMTRQEKYIHGLTAKKLKSVRVIIPERSEQILRQWAEEERQGWREEREDIACIDDPAEDPRNQEKT